MANVAVIGAQWGDEGKGKVVDWLASRADIVVRFQGGHNAGHTLVIDGTVFKLALLPSGIVRPGKLAVIGNGVVLDPYHLADEIETIRSRGVEVTPDNLKIAENVSLILSLHRELDAARESGGAGGTKIGTTKRGIGPAYEDKVGRRAIRLMDLAEPDALSDKIERLLAQGHSVTVIMSGDVVCLAANHATGQKWFYRPLSPEGPYLPTPKAWCSTFLLFAGVYVCLVIIGAGFVSGSPAGATVALFAGGIGIYVLVLLIRYQQQSYREAVAFNEQLDRQLERLADVSGLKDRPNRFRAL